MTTGKAGWEEEAMRKLRLSRTFYIPGPVLDNTSFKLHKKPLNTDSIESILMMDKLRLRKLKWLAKGQWQSWHLNSTPKPISLSRTIKILGKGRQTNMMTTDFH